VISPRLAGHRLHENEIQSALMLVALYGGAIVLSWLPFVAGGYDPLNALFEVVSALGTAGLSAGITGPHLPAALKSVLCADMLLGRLEIVAWLVLLYPNTWLGRRSKVT
jgi:trk/ktr system potassium uptake protein